MEPKKSDGAVLVAVFIVVIGIFFAFIAILPPGGGHGPSLAIGKAEVENPGPEMAILASSSTTTGSVEISDSDSPTLLTSQESSPVIVSQGNIFKPLLTMIKPVRHSRMGFVDTEDSK